MIIGYDLLLKMCGLTNSDKAGTHTSFNLLSNIISSENFQLFQMVITCDGDILYLYDCWEWSSPVMISYFCMIARQKYKTHGLPGLGGNKNGGKIELLFLKIDRK